jgi:peptide chain release factor 3
VAGQEELSPERAEAQHGDAWRVAVEEAALLDPADAESFLTGQTTPMLFGAAVLNIGVRQLLETLVELAPRPHARPDAQGQPRAVEAPFSGVVFKVQAGMDASHRDRVAFVRVCSGRFERGMVVTHAATGRPFSTKYAQAMFGRDRGTVELAYPGDIIGLVNASALTAGDTLHAELSPVRFPGMPAFAPENFAVARAADAGRAKQFRRGNTQLEQEGAVQVLRSDLRGDAAPVLAAVGPLQFEVAAHRLEHEFRAPVRLEHLPYSLAMLTRPEHAASLAAERGVEVTERSDRALLALFPDRWRLDTVRRQHPHAVLEPLVACTTS